MASILDFISDYLWLFGLAIFVYLFYRALLKKSIKEKEAKRQYKSAVEKQLTEPMTLHPEVDPAKCAGCGACVEVCPEGDI